MVLNIPAIIIFPTRFCSYGNCPIPIINMLDLTQCQYSTAVYRKKDFHSLKSLCRQTQEEEDERKSFTCDWSLPRCRTAQSKADQQWCCGHNRWGSPRCRLHYIWKEKEAKHEKSKWRHSCLKTNRTYKVSLCTHFGSSSVMIPLGSASMLFPQNLSLG